MIFDAHSDILYAALNLNTKDLLKHEIGILNYYFKGSENHDHFLFVLEQIKKIKKDIHPLSILSIEGLGPLERIEEVSLLKQVGIRSVMLTWNEENKWATGALGRKERGITKSGFLLLKELEKYGFILDLSHLNQKSFFEAIKYYKGKVFASHSNAFSLCPNLRNLTDDQIVAIANRKGVIGINAYIPFVGDDDLDKYIDHIEYIVKLTNDKVPCLGFDFDYYFGKSSCLTELSSLKDANKLIDRLKERGFSEETIDNITYKNISRFLNL